MPLTQTSIPHRIYDTDPPNTLVFTCELPAHSGTGTLHLALQAETITLRDAERCITSAQPETQTGSLQS